jgi:hypothetical protein
MHLCSLAEANIAWQTGYRSCGWGWVSNPAGASGGYRILPTSGGAGCGNNGLDATVAGGGETWGAYCCH